MCMLSLCYTCSIAYILQICGKRQWIEISAEQHELVKEVLDFMESIPPSPHWCRKKKLCVPLMAYFMGARAAPLAASASTATSRYTPSSLAASTTPSFSSPTSLPGSQHSAILSTSSNQQSVPHTTPQAQSVAQGTSSQAHNYILFGVESGKRTLVPAQVPVYDWSTDASVFKGLKQCYQAQRGWLRLWFSVWRLDFCAVVKVTISFKSCH